MSMSCTKRTEMALYISVSVVKARPITRGQYNEVKGWKTRDNEDPNEEGYLVEQLTNPKVGKTFSKFVTKRGFEFSYKPVKAEDFGLAAKQEERKAVHNAVAQKPVELADEQLEDVSQLPF